jgi:hypothetical protein
VKPKFSPIWLFLSCLAAMYFCGIDYLQLWQRQAPFLSQRHDEIGLRIFGILGIVALLLIVILPYYEKFRAARLLERERLQFERKKEAALAKHRTG